MGQLIFKPGDWVRRPHWTEFYEVVSFDGVRLCLKSPHSSSVLDYTLNLYGSLKGAEFIFKERFLDEAKTALEAAGYTVTPPKPKEKGKVVVYRYTPSNSLCITSKREFDDANARGGRHSRRVLSIVEWEEGQGLD